MDFNQSFVIKNAILKMKNNPTKATSIVHIRKTNGEVVPKSLIISATMYSCIGKSTEVTVVSLLSSHQPGNCLL